jgi:hypothetical protein
MDFFYVGQDLRITLNIHVSCTGGTCKIKYKSPAGTAGEWAGIISATNSKQFYHDATPAELSIAGVWTFWGHAVLASGKIIIGKIVTLRIRTEGT